MKILLAGGAGYIGSSLVPVLLEHGYTTDVVDLMWFGNSIPDTVNIRRQDIFDLKEVDVSGYDQVIFLAGLSNDPMAEFDPSKNFVSNGACPSYLAYICKRAGVRRFIYASSCSVYGYTVNELYDEESPVTCGYPYGVSKLQGERGVLQLADDNFSVIALRQGTLLPPPRHTCEHQFGVACQADIRADTQLFTHARAVGVDENIRILHHAQQGFEPAGILQVDHHRLLAPRTDILHHQRTGSRRPINSDNLSAHVG